MKLIDREDLVLLPLFATALLVRWSRLPAIRRAAARFLAALAYRFSRTKRRLMEQAVNAACGTSITPGERKAIIFGSMRSVWTELFTLLSGPLARQDYLPCEIRGLDRLHTSLAAGHGVILWESNGLAARWMPKRFLLERGFPLHQVHGYYDIGGLYSTDPQLTIMRRRLILPLVSRCEAYFVAGASVLPADGSVAIFREFHRRMAQNEILCIAGDGLGGQKRVSVPYLGQSIRFATGMVSLAKATGAALHPVFCVPCEGGGYVLTVGECMAAGRHGDREDTAKEAVLTFARSLEQSVRRFPGHYRNWHQVALENCLSPKSQSL
jgi:lauroyl/myristoyl acyltransferase